MAVLLRDVVMVVLQDSQAAQLLAAQQGLLANIGSAQQTIGGINRDLLSQAQLPQLGSDSVSDCVHLHVWVYMCGCACAGVHVGVHVWVCMYGCACVGAHVWVCIWCAYVGVHVWVCMCGCACVGVHVWVCTLKKWCFMVPLSAWL